MILIPNYGERAKRFTHRLAFVLHRFGTRCNPPPPHTPCKPSLPLYIQWSLGLRPSHISNNSDLDQKFKEIFASEFDQNSDLDQPECSRTKGSWPTEAEQQAEAAAWRRPRR